MMLALKAFAFCAALWLSMVVVSQLLMILVHRQGSIPWLSWILLSLLWTAVYVLP